MTAPTQWRPTVALLTAVVTAGGALLLAVLLRRADLVVVAAPFVAGTAAALLRRAPHEAGARLELGVSTTRVWEGDEVGVVARVVADRSLDAVLVHVDGSDGLPVPRPDQMSCIRPDAREPVEVTAHAEARRWGRWTIGATAASAYAAHGLLRSGCDARDTVFVSALPARDPFEATDALPNAAGMVGGHRSLRPGDGGDLVSLRPFVAGDRLRRITWPASLRTGVLHVRATTEDRDADVQLILDSWSQVVGRDGRSSLDTTVGAAASIAEHYLAAGDRIGLLDLGRPTRPVPLGAGRRHLEPVTSALLAARPRTPDPDVADRALRQVRSGALVIVLTALLSDPIVRLLATLARSGRSVLVVDTLPPHLDVAAVGEWTPLAWRLALLRRDTLAESLAEHGVPIARWQGGRSLDLVLHRLAALNRAPRRVR